MPRMLLRWRISFRVALCAAFALASGGLARAAEPEELVVLLHPKMKDWSMAITNGMKLTNTENSQGWGIWGYKATGKPLHPKCPVRIEVGPAAKAVKNWSLLLQFEAPVFGAQPGALVVPFVVWYRKDLDAKSVEVARGTVFDSGNNYAHAVQNLCVARIRAIDESLKITQAAKVFADKPTVADSSGIAYAFAPIKVDLKADPPTASVRLHNKHPIPVGMYLTLQGKVNAEPGDQVFEVSNRDSATNTWPLVLEAGEEKTLTIALKNLKPGQAPRLCKLANLFLMLPVGEKK